MGARRISGILNFIVLASCVNELDSLIILYFVPLYCRPLAPSIIEQVSLHSDRVSTAHSHCTRAGCVCSDGTLCRYSIRSAEKCFFSDRLRCSRATDWASARAPGSQKIPRFRLLTTICHPLRTCPKLSSSLFFGSGIFCPRFITFVDIHIQATSFL